MTTLKSDNKKFTGIQWRIKNKWQRKCINTTLLEHANDNINYELMTRKFLVSAVITGRDKNEAEWQNCQFYTGDRCTTSPWRKRHHVEHILTTKKLLCLEVVV